MAQYVFDANKYPVGTDLAQLGFSYATNDTYVVTEIVPGRNYWRKTGNGFNTVVESNISASTGIEILLLCDYAISEVVDSTLVMYAKIGSYSTQDLSFGYTRSAANSETSNSFYPTIPGGQFTGLTTNTVTTASTLTANAMRFRYESASGLCQVRVWGAAIGGLEAAEPVIWHRQATYINTVDTYNPSVLNSYVNVADFDGVFSCISIGTDGDSAPYPDPNQTVTTPSGLSVTNITATTADADWT